jgi:hypothetical protein
MSTPIIIGGGPPKSKFRRWLGTSTAKAMIAAASLGTTAIANPAVQAAVEATLRGLSAGQQFGVGLVATAALAGIARARSA